MFLSLSVNSSNDMGYPIRNFPRKLYQTKDHEVQFARSTLNRRLARLSTGTARGRTDVVSDWVRL